MKRMLMVLLLGIFTAAGCFLPSRALDQHANMPAISLEPEWIRNGEPLEIEKTIWYPTDEVERLMEDEMVQIGVFRNVAVFIERVDVKPYARVYTRFDRSRYRSFEPRIEP